MVKETLFFKSGKDKCAAVFYRPDESEGKVPCVVMGNGFSGTMDFALPDYAKSFTSSGLAVLAFDYRHFGESGGQPRQLVHIKRQLEDFHAAVHFARSIEVVDSERIAIWGSSLGGGHVFAVAAADPRITAVVSQVPFVGVEYGRSSPRSTQTTLKLFRVAIKDALGSILGFPPYLVPVIGNPGDIAIFTEPGTKEVMDAAAIKAPNWRNEAAARVLLSLPRYRPGKKSKYLAMPLLMCIAEKDTAGSVPLAIQAAEQAVRAEVRRYQVGHFDVYNGEALNQLASDEASFLRFHLLNPSRGQSCLGRS